MPSLYSRVLRLAHARLDLRPVLLPVLVRTGKAEFTELPEDPWRYFKRVPGTILVPVRDLVPLRARPEGIAHAHEYMAAAYRGEGERRKPLSLTSNGDGTYTVADGNSTYANAVMNGWRFLPGVVEAEPVLHG